MKSTASRKHSIRILLLSFIAGIGFSLSAVAQDLNVVTVTRPPFSMPGNGGDIGFSLDLWRAVASELELTFTVTRVAEFGEMLDLIRTGNADIAVANVSVTADREAVMDFSQPIFESGLQIMIPSGGGSGVSIFSILFSKTLLTAVVASIGLLFGAGMLMWFLEKRVEPYFDKPAKQAVFPAFWWALNLVVNGGFEERVPKTPLGRVFGVFLVITSLFVVSIFVANVTASLTIGAIQNNVNSINDLNGKQIGTIEGSTASTFIESRNLRYIRFSGLEQMLAEFENGNLDAIVFDAPILAFYANQPDSRAEMVGAMFRRENYGFALPSGSELAEPINQSLLRLRENGTYEIIYKKWFGDSSNL